MTAGSRHALRRVVGVWLLVAILEFAIWWALYRSPFYRPLWALPATLLLVVGVAGTAQAVRGRRRDRRAADRRAGSEAAG